MVGSPRWFRRGGDEAEGEEGHEPESIPNWAAAPPSLHRAFLQELRDLGYARAGAVIVPNTVLFLGERRRLVALAAKHRLPALNTFREFVDAGGLMSYGHNQANLNRRAANYVDRILKGARPADLPVEQPTRFDLVINLKSAKALGLTIPPSVLARADQVIE